MKAYSVDKEKQTFFQKIGVEGVGSLLDSCNYELNSDTNI
jgi:hypothetical protein